MDVRIGEDDGQRALFVDGVVQSILIEPDTPWDSYWAAMLPDQRPRQALLLGLGGGTIAQLLHQRFGPVPIVGVDDDPQVLALARESRWLDLPNLHIEQADAFEFVAQCADQFSLVCVDLYRGPAFDRRIVSRPFLRGLTRLLEPGGLVTFNLYRDRRAPTAVRRIHRLLRIVQQTPCGKNLVVHARPGRH